MLSDCRGILRAVTEVGMLAQWPSVVVVQCRPDYQCSCFGVTVSMSEINIVNNGNRVVVEKKNCRVYKLAFIREDIDDECNALNKYIFNISYKFIQTK